MSAKRPKPKRTPKPRAGRPKADPAAPQSSQARAEQFVAALAVLAAGSRKAARKLVALLDSNDPWLRLAAAVKILELGRRLRESEDLAGEVAAIRHDLREALARK